MSTLKRVDDKIFPVILVLDAMPETRYPIPTCNGKLSGSPKHQQCHLFEYFFKVFPKIWEPEPAFVVSTPQVAPRKIFEIFPTKVVSKNR
ncbi:MAG: hypothetical protein CM15mP44_4370 [Candidatus Neomarinimicrobiota bacterium]|nr:MAG: hypothetical protein CM15mP44_4370 [Candidatus Neomarinimicrobiota bacterium]